METLSPGGLGELRTWQNHSLPPSAISAVSGDSNAMVSRCRSRARPGATIGRWPTTLPVSSSGVEAQGLLNTLVNERKPTPPLQKQSTPHPSVELLIIVKVFAFKGWCDKEIIMADTNTSLPRGLWKTDFLTGKGYIMLYILQGCLLQGWPKSWPSFGKCHSWTTCSRVPGGGGKNDSWAPPQTYSSADEAYAH